MPQTVDEEKNCTLSLLRWVYEVDVGKGKVGYKSVVCLYAENRIFALSYKAILFLKNNFLFSQKHLPTKFPHSLKHITYCPPKSGLAFL